MTSYCSFLIADPRHCSLITTFSKLAEWPISFLPDPSQRFWFHEHGRTVISHPEALGSQAVSGMPGQMLLIDTAEETVANNIAQLICAAYDIIEGNPGDRVGLRSVFPLPADATERNSIYENLFRTHGFFEQFVGPPELPVAVATAAKAWSDKS